MTDVPETVGDFTLEARDRWGIAWSRPDKGIADWLETVRVYRASTAFDYSVRIAHGSESSNPFDRVSYDVESKHPEREDAISAAVEIMERLTE